MTRIEQEGACLMKKYSGQNIWAGARGYCIYPNSIKSWCASWLAAALRVAARHTFRLAAAEDRSCAPMQAGGKPLGAQRIAGARSGPAASAAGRNPRKAWFFAALLQKMRHNDRRKVSAIFAVAPVLLLLCLFPPLAAAQTRTEERVETGRFGTEEVDSSGTDGGQKGFDTDWVYLGLRVGPSLRIYTPSNDARFTGGDTRAVSLDTVFQVNVQLLSFLSIQTEALFTWDNASLWAYNNGSGMAIDRYTKDYTALSFQFPLIAKFDFYPGGFRVSPFIGAYYMAPLGKLKTSNSLNSETHSLSYKISSPLGLVGGISGATKFGAGIIFADLRYASDLGEFEAKEGDIQEFKRSALSLTLGYELGFFSKKKGAKP
jgi:hypothetical protein